MLGRYRRSCKTKIRIYKSNFMITKQPGFIGPTGSTFTLFQHTYMKIIHFKIYLCCNIKEYVRSIMQAFTQRDTWISPKTNFISKLYEWKCVTIVQINISQSKLRFEFQFWNCPTCYECLFTVIIRCFWLSRFTFFEL